jgi:two-component system, OmpR family, phosphate regulon sensor histidine kinase PhoR
MSKRAIWTIIIIMTLALVGVGVIQFFWIKWSVDLDEKTFNNKVRLALNNVKDRLKKDADQQYYEIHSTEEVIEKNFESTVSKDLKINYSTPKSAPKDFDFDYFYADALENIDKDNLDRYLKYELQEIDLDYEYGVFSQKDKAYFIENGHYNATIGDTTKSSNVAAMNPLYKAEYKIPLFSDGNFEPGHLNLYFPRKARFLWANVIPILISSIIFTGLILFCFAYTIYVIFRQKKVSEMKTDFINNMTHEFKTPIATISLASDAILSPVISENREKVNKFIGIIKQENTRMLNQVEKVLQMAQIDKENVQLKIIDLDLHELIAEAIVNADLKVQAKGGSITTILSAKNHLIKADTTHLSSVINNLLDNAEKYTPEKPMITVSTLDVKGGIEISVQDNGIGMTKDALKHIFEKFYRVHTGNLHNVKGFGLGLSYVKAMVDAHGGKISASSEIGKGSIFIIFLPTKKSFPMSLS